jgi:hypothetical protein
LGWERLFVPAGGARAGIADELARATIPPKPENRLDRNNGEAAQAEDVALPACHTNTYIVAVQAEPAYMKDSATFQHIARVEPFRKQPLNAGEMQHATANLTRPYMLTSLIYSSQMRHS